MLESIDKQIDVTTGTLKLKARFDNEAELLLPNQFVNVRLRVETLKDVTLIPSAALQFGSRGNFAYVVNADSKVELRNVEVGPSNGELTVITAGLKPDERVVIFNTGAAQKYVEAIKSELVHLDIRRGVDWTMILDD